MQRISYIAWLVVVLALSACAGVAYFAWTIAQDKKDRIEILASTQETSLRQAAAARIHALVTDTVSQRKELEGLLPPDVLSVAGLIRDAGVAAGVALELSNALPETPSSSDVSPVHAIGFLVQAKGSFPALMRAIAILETLPVAVSVQRFDIERTSAGGGVASNTSWHMSVYIRALTTALVSL